MKIIDYETIDYKKSLKLMDELIKDVNIQKEDILFFCTHDSVYTVGSESVNVDFEVIKSDRGGSITYHDRGCLMVYFIFQVKNPPIFFKHIIKIFKKFFKLFDENIYYDSAKPGFYIENRKIASLGFRYKDGVSKHGVSLHLSPDLANFNKINPCNLKGIVATSFENEKIAYNIKEIKSILIELIKNEFYKTKS